MKKQPRSHEATKLRSFWLDLDADAPPSYIWEHAVCFQLRGFAASQLRSLPRSRA